MMKAVSITGFKNSGKTTLTLLLAEALEKRGLRVAIAKRSHHVLDKPSSDTGRFRGARRTVLALSENESAVFWGRERSLAELVPLLEGDILLVEGGKGRHWLPRILCLHDASEAEALHKGLAIACYGQVRVDGLPHFDAEHVDGLAELVQQRAFMLPGLDCGACGLENCHAMSQALVRQEDSLNSCVALEASVRVSVNGHEIGLNPFTARIMGGALRGMLRELKGVDQGEVEVRLRIDKR